MNEAVYIVVTNNNGDLYIDTYANEEPAVMYARQLATKFAEHVGDSEFMHKDEAPSRGCIYDYTCAQLGARVTVLKSEIIK